MQRKVVERGKRNAVSRFFLSKDDKDKIAAWKQDLVRILQVFNVRSHCCWEFVNLGSSIQTQLVLDTHKEVADARVTIANTETVVENTQKKVTDTQTMVADIHRKVLAGQEGTSSQNHSVGVTYHSQISECLRLPRPEPGQRYSTLWDLPLTFS
jgi:hypothetical protein